MSSSISADYSPASNYSYPSDLSLPASSPVRPSRPNPSHAPPPRLSSPHIFRDIFADENAGPSIRSPPRLPPLHGINYAETMQDVNRALQSANRALRTAQQAFRSRNTTSANTSGGQNVVDLTNSPPSPALDDRSYDSFLTRTLHPHDSQSGNWMANGTLNQPFYPTTNTLANAQSLFVEEDDPTSLYAGQSDSLAGARRRYDTQQANHRRSFMTIPNMERTLVRSGVSAARCREEEEAIRRQRIAREQWEQNQQRQRQRERLQQQRDRILARTQQRNNAPQHEGQRLQSHVRQPAESHMASGPAYNQSPVSAVSSSSVEAVDLTSVNNTNDLAAVLLHAQSSNRTADPTSTSTEPRSALTGYKCPVCLEPPRNATSTICGHLFCHECILETLKHSENIRREDAPPHRKVKGQCPVCRKELARKEDEGPTRTLVPLEIKLISKRKMEELREKERKRQREMEEEEKDKQSKGKGKGKEKEVSYASGDPYRQVFELSSDDEDDWGISGDSQKENKAKRIKLSASEELDNELFGEFTNNWQVDTT